MLTGIVESMLASPVGRLLLLALAIWFAMFVYGIGCDARRARAERRARRRRVTVEEIREERKQLSD